jgi:hypothetical protein
MAFGNLGLTGGIAWRKKRLHQRLKPARGKTQWTSEWLFGVTAST